MPTTTTTPCDTPTHQTADDLPQEVGFVDNPEFRGRGAADRILECGPDGRLADDPAPRLPRPPRDLPAYLASLYEVPLLGPDAEPRAFRRFNFAKYRAARLLKRIDRTNPDPELLAEIREWLRIANETRDAIVRANLRLVVSIARRFVSPTRTFDDLVCEGNLILLQAAENFDYGRGFRFSTYATHAVQRSLHRTTGRRQRDATRFATGHETYIDATPARADDTFDEAETQTLVRRVLEHVDEEFGERERSILLARYGLDDGGVAQTLKQLSARFGICKERIRQIQLKALDKLRDFALAPA